MRMDVDEAGGDVVPGDVDAVRRGTPREIPDFYDDLVEHGDVGRESRRPGAVHHHTALEYEVEFGLAARGNQEGCQNT